MVWNRKDLSESPTGIFWTYGDIFKEKDYVKLKKFNKPQKDFLYANVQRWLSSPKHAEMLNGKRYYKNHNDIKNRERYLLGPNGQKFRNVNVSNKRISHAWFKKLVSQKMDYLLSKDYTISCENENYLKQLEENYFTKEFKGFLKRVCKETVIKGICYIYVYYDLEGKLSWQIIPAEQIWPFWKDPEQEELEAILRVYEVQELQEDGTWLPVQRVEFYNDTGITTFDVIEDKFVDKGNRDYFKIEGKPSAFKKLPFVIVKYNEECDSLLNYVKDLIDEYDLAASDLADFLADVPSSIMVVKAFQAPNLKGEEGEKFINNLNYFRAIFVRGEGDVDRLEQKIDINAYKEHLARLKRDLYEAANGVDTSSSENVKGSVSGVAQKMRYTDLRNDCEQLGNRMAHAIIEMKYFVDADMGVKNNKTKPNENLETTKPKPELNTQPKQIQPEKQSKNTKNSNSNSTDIEIQFTLGEIVDEASVCNNLIALRQAGLISTPTALSAVPYVDDVSAEMNMIQNDQMAEQQREQEMEQFKIQAKANADIAVNKSKPAADAKKKVQGKSNLNKTYNNKKPGQ